MQTTLDSLPGEQSRSEHDRRVAGIGATCDGSNEHASVPNLTVGWRRGRDRRVRCWPIVGHFQFGERIGVTGLSGLGRNRFLAPSSGMYSTRGTNLEGSAQFFARLAKAVFGNRPNESADELLLQIRQFDSVLRPFWAGDTWHDRRQIQFELQRIANLAFRGHAEQTLSTIIILVNAAMAFAPAGGPQIIDALGI